FLRGHRARHAAELRHPGRGSRPLAGHSCAPACPCKSPPALFRHGVPDCLFSKRAAVMAAPIHVIPARDEANIEQKLVTLLLAAVQEKPDLIISVFAGTPAFGAYHLLAERARSELVDFSQVRFVVFDELLTPSGAGQFRAVLDERLFIPLGVPPDNIVAFSPSGD